MFMTEFDQESLREFDRKEGYDQGYDQATAQFSEKLRELGVDESLLAAALGSLSAGRG